MIKRVVFTILTWILAVLIFVIYPVIVEINLKDYVIVGMALIVSSASIARLIYIKLNPTTYKDGGDDIRILKIALLGSVIVLFPSSITHYLNLDEYTNVISLILFIVAIVVGSKYSKFLEKKDRPVSEKPRVKLKLKND
jgi:Kef-type K+ transport system membrane component KefB